MPQSSLCLVWAAFAALIHPASDRVIAAGAPAPVISVHASGHYLQTSDGRPFFWLGDTAWMLIHGTTRDECTYYLRTRARQGFTVVQTVILSEMNGVNGRSALGELPLIDGDPTRPNETYFNRVVEIVDEAGALGLQVALLPAWGDKLTAPWGDGPRLFRLDNLPVVRAYGRYLAQKLHGRANVIWMLGGDRPAKLDPTKPDGWQQRSGAAAGFPLDQDWRPIWREMVEGLKEGDHAAHLFLYHPEGGATTAPTLHDEPWLAINGMQSGHGEGHDFPVWDWAARDFALTPAKPTIDLEPNYEDHPVNPWPRWDPTTGYFRDDDVRKQCYRSVLAGACGVTYGHHAVWGFVGVRNDVINHADRDWVDAMHRPGARQMQFLRALIESRPFFSRTPDPAVVDQPPHDPALHIVASRDRDGAWALVYFPQSNQTARIDLARLRAGKFRVSWFDPRTGFAHPGGEIDGGSAHVFRSPSQGPDWVLALDAIDAGLPLPGQVP